MTKLRVALLQMAACGSDQAANLAKGELFCRCARQAEADIALFPEMWNIGYSFYDPAVPASQLAWQESAIALEDGFVTHFQALARDLQMAIGLTFLERTAARPRNTLALIDRCGVVVLTYAKVHTCAFDIEAALAPGDDFYVAPLETAAGTVLVGAMICFDREFPESARLLMLKGAELILVPNACDLEINRLSQFRARAYENMAGLAMANYAAPQANGHSVAFDGIAFQPDGRSRDMLVIEAGEAEGVYLAEFDLERLRRYREHEVWGNAFRHPGKYDLLVSPDVRPPFIRPHPED